MLFHRLCDLPDTAGVHVEKWLVGRVISQPSKSLERLEEGIGYNAFLVEDDQLGGVWVTPCVGRDGLGVSTRMIHKGVDH